MTRGKWLMAGAGSLLLALGLLSPWPFTRPSAGATHALAPVTAVIRNDLGQLKWVRTEGADYTATEEAGRQIYLAGGCSYCHSQHVRPVKADDSRPWGPVSAEPRRWGPVSEAAEYAGDPQQVLGNPGIAPDLAREGLKYSDEWHLAHFWNPPLVTQGSIMGGVAGLFDAPPDPVKIVHDSSAGATLEQTPATEALFDFKNKEQVKLTPNADGLLFVPMSARGKYPLIWTPNDEYAGSSLKLVAETKEIGALIAYVQKLGMARGRWRELFEPQEVDGSQITLARSAEWIARGQRVYERRCVACHGVKGDGNGWASTFLYRQRPRNFTMGVFKFRLAKGLLPTDADLMRTITRGVRGTAMPAWFELPIEDRLAVMQYVKYELAVDRSDPQKPDYYFADEPPGRSHADRPAASALGRASGPWRQGLAAGQMLGVPRRRRQRRW